MTTSGTSGIVDNNDGHLPTHKASQHVLASTAGLNLPILGRNVITLNARQTNEKEAVLEALVLAEVSQLGVDGGLHLEVLVQPAVVLFQGHHSVLKTASGLTDDRRLDLGWKIDVCKHSLGAVEKMEQELKSGIGCQMNAIILKVWCSETRKEIEVGRHVGGEDLGELLQDLGQALAVPEGQGHVHWRSDEKSPIWMSVAEVAEDLANLEKHRLDSKSDSGSTAG